MLSQGLRQRRSKPKRNAFNINNLQSNAEAAFTSARSLAQFCQTKALRDEWSRPSQARLKGQHINSCSRVVHRPFPARNQGIFLLSWTHQGASPTKGLGRFNRLLNWLAGPAGVGALWQPLQGSQCLRHGGACALLAGIVACQQERGAGLSFPDAHAHYSSITQRNPSVAARSLEGAINRSLPCSVSREELGKYQCEPCGK
jgi:hypothetical protein